MSLAATLAAGGMRPASFLPTIKCSDCGHEIEISAMGDHLCGQAPEPSRAPMTGSNNDWPPQQWASNPQRPAQPSPLSQTEPASQIRAPMPPFGSVQMPTPKVQRPALPRINSEVANKPFLPPFAHADSPISPATSTRSGHSNGGKPPAMRGVPSPAPRLWDLRPPSPEMSSNIDCAFPIFPPPIPVSSGSRPGTSAGRNTPTGSERAASRSGSRQGGKLPVEPFDFEPKSPRINAGETMLQKMNNLKSGPFDASRRKPSNDGRAPQEAVPLDRRRPSLPHVPPAGDNASRASTASSNYSEMPLQPTGPGNPIHFSRPSISTSNMPSLLDTEAGERTGPLDSPARPADEALSPYSLDQLDAEPLPAISSVFSPSQPPVPARSVERDRTPPLRQDSSNESTPTPSLTKTSSEPAIPVPERRPSLPYSSKSEPFQVPQVQPPGNSSRNGDRIDWRMHDAPPVPKPVQQLNRKPSLHAPSESGSSTTSTANSVGHSNSSNGPSPVGSAASSLDAFSPLSYDAREYQEGLGGRIAGSHVKNQQTPGERAEQPAQRSPPRSMPRILTVEEPAHFDESHMEPPPVTSAGGDWPLESPMDPALENQQLKADKYEPGPKQRQPLPQQQQQQARSRAQSDARQRPPPRQGPPPDLPPLTVPQSMNPTFEPYQSQSPQPRSPMPPRQDSRGPSALGEDFRQRQQPPPQSRSRPRSKTTGPQSTPFAAFPGPRSLTPQPSRRPSMPQNSPQRGQPSPQPFMPPQPRKDSLVPRTQSPLDTTSPLSRQPSPLGMPAPNTAPSETTTPRHQLSRRPTTAGKHVCRGCGLKIEGKSVKAADGRLTGRWHKACFVCRTCDQPFTTADFYVIDNQPYCEQHYHEKNGSLCQGCHRGIEGHHLETTSANTMKKYHPRCFTCVECRSVLSEDYFEIAGRVFCERHALASMRARPRGAAGPGSPGPYSSHSSGLRAERRTTRPMMM